MFIVRTNMTVINARKNSAFLVVSNIIVGYYVGFIKKAEMKQI